MTSSLHQGWVVLSSLILQALISNIHSLAPMIGTCALMFALFLQFNPTASCNVTPDDKPPKRGRAVRRTPESGKIDREKRNISRPRYTHAPGVDLKRYLRIGISWHIISPRRVRRNKN